jgi:hypothetical protein
VDDSLAKGKKPTVNMSSTGLAVLKRKTNQRKDRQANERLSNVSKNITALLIGMKTLEEKSLWFGG